MIDKELVSTCVGNFNIRMELAKRQVNENGTFDNAVSNLLMSNECIDALEDIVKQMKQERHNITQDVYNKFKGKNYVKTIKF
jgi:hypothetical protein